MTEDGLSVSGNPRLIIDAAWMACSANPIALGDAGQPMVSCWD